MTAGRPALYTDPEEMEKLIDEYFRSCTPIPRTMPDPKDPDKIKSITDKHGRPLFDSNPPTITGLALHLGFESRQSMYDYEKRDDKFSYIIKRARLQCENYAEKQLLSGEPAAGFIFTLKNYGWRDNQSIEHTGKDGESLPVNIIIKGVEK